MRSHSYLNSAEEILRTYDGSIPFAAWLRQFFAKHKKFGGTDRKQVAHLCFSYYRLGNAFRDISTQEKILTGVFLSAVHTLVIRELKPEWEKEMALSLEEKLEWLGAADEIKNIIPFPDALSNEVELVPFSRSFLVQPSMFLRIRPNKQQHVQRMLEQAEVKYQAVTDEIVALDVGNRIEAIINLDEDAVVQDMNSQRVIELTTEHLQAGDPFSIWDCCAASGGKSILFHDHFPRAKLTVSDVRESIMFNLQQRFKKAGIRQYRHFITDLSQGPATGNAQYDLVICDAPCSGSGTWSRTPEQMHFFKKEKIDGYASLQKKIVTHAAAGVKKNGLFLYITCSVFKQENEEVVAYIKDHLNLQLLSARYFMGYEQRADTLFGSLFIAG